ncbi:MAG: hypothetical protein ACYC0Q_11435 [Eubacteriales bacterium]
MEEKDSGLTVHIICIRDCHAVKDTPGSVTIFYMDLSFGGPLEKTAAGGGVINALI